MRSFRWLFGLLVTLPLWPVIAAAADGPAQWPRWLDAGNAPFRYPARLACPGEGAHCGIAPPADAGEPAFDWTRLAIDLVRRYQRNPLRSARALALMHVAQHDAIVLSARAGLPEAARLAAAHRAASLVVAHLYPDEPVAWLEGLGLALAHGGLATPTTDVAEKANGIGEQAAGDAIRRTLEDGADRRRAIPPPVSVTPGRWRPTPPLNIHPPAEPLAGDWLPWVAATGEIDAPPPPAFDSPRYRQEVEEVLAIQRALTPAQRAVASAWDLDLGTATPPGVWNERALALIRLHKLSPTAATRVLAALNVAMTDALVACWRVKYRWWTVRPVTVIRERLDPDFLPHLITPAHPSYVSGHASASGAAAAVLVRFFPEQRAGIEAAAEEAAMSRLYGGIHFRSDNDEGLKLGRRIGALIADKALGVASDQRDAAMKP